MLVDRRFGKAAAVLAALYLLGGTCFAANPQNGDNSIAIRAGYHICLTGEFRKIVSIDLEDPDLYALARLTDEEVFPILKSHCAATRSSLLSLAGDPQKARQALDEEDAEGQKTVPDKLKRVRPEMAKTVRMIRAPGPRSAIPLSEPNVGFYPSAALRNNEQGTSNATYTVGVDGRVSDCSAEGATEALNVATCRMIQRHWRYAPAVDAKNQPVSEVRKKSLTFSIR